MPDPRHVFISYSRTDTAVMLRVKQSLLDYPLAVWTDEGIAPGTSSWKRAISTAIEQSACLVCLLSPDAKNSEWVQRELDYAEAQGVPIFALMVRGNTTTSVPFALIGTQFVDIQSDYEGGINRLLPILARICLEDAPADPEVTVISHAIAIHEQTQIDPAAMEKAPAKSKPLLEHIPTLEAAPVDYSKIKPVTRNKDWTPIIRVINGIEMCLVPPGCFMMGSEDGNKNERPVHQRCIERPFWIGRYPVTNAQYAGAVTAGVCQPSKFADDADYNQRQQPVVGVSWDGAMKYAMWKGMILPTESQWEYAARGPESWVWPWGNEFVAANLVYGENSGGRTAPVGSKPDSMAWNGALDMSGNVWEWCLTKWRNTYSEQEDNNPKGDAVRVLRGGSLSDDHLGARAASRLRLIPSYGFSSFGFRVVAAPAF